MASSVHEGIVYLFRNRPELAPELLRDVLHVALPAYTEVRIESADLTEVVPAEFHADLVVLMVDGKPVFAAVVEVQLAVKPRKRFTWPVYATTSRARFECPAVVLVVTPDSSVAEWARKAVDLGGGSVFRPLVLGPDGVPIITDEQAAARAPELAVLSALAHGASDAAAEIAKAAVRAAEGLPDDRRTVYWDLVYVAVNAAARRALEALVLPSGYQFQSEIARRSFETGKAEGSSEAIFDVLEARGLAPTDAQRERILACTNLDQLREWHRRAITASRVDDLFV